MLGRRIGRGGLLRAAVTTAVVSGTATAVSGRVQARQADRAQQAADAQAYEQQQNANALYAQQATAPPPPAPAAPSAGNDLMAQLQSLATLHAQGILSEDEFAAAKAKLLT